MSRFSGPAALVAVLLAVLTASPAAGSTAASSSHGSACASDQADAVTLVIDYQALGGATDVYCVSGLPSGATGWDVLKGAGIPVAGTVNDGMSMICRVNSRPSQTEVIRRDGDPGYTEHCVDDPPPNAYWSYWSAAPGGPWSYAQLGVMAHRAPLGGFEGWSFSLNATAGTNPAPRVAPVPLPASAPESAPSAAPPPPGTAIANSAPVAAPPAATPGSATTPTPTTDSPSTAPSPAQAAPDSPTASAAPSRTPEQPALAADTQEPTPHLPTTLLALAAAGAVALATVAIGARRRRAANERDAGASLGIPPDRDPGR